MTGSAHLLHSIAINTQSETQLVFRTEFDGTSLGGARDGVGKGLGLVRRFCLFSGDGDRNAGVLARELSMSMDEIERSDSSL